ncbi:SMR family transporter [Pseudoduganella namucuonensis]|uniref:Small multidrug resistance pump n=1 Tax=Pseudoduganella namucuonensis TaxID=1035707 RepID=A0A1I7FSW5_9BURK|nr:SMR family transporter [Pseudoduganella namucuonensis]SFU39248.1 small multidrug resistance pump [Pseudoduganella namucuonensis]
MNPAYTGYLWCAGAALASALSTYLIKLSGQNGADWNLVRLAWLGGACASYGLGFVCYSIALQRLQVSLAYPVMTAITLALVALIGYAALQEPMSAAKLAGIVLVGAGAFMLAR